jgi:hypothetical protein
MRRQTMSDPDETHATFKPTCGLDVHAWEVTLDHNDEETTHEFRGTERGVVKYMAGVFDQVFDGGLTSEGYQPSTPALVAHCQQHDITLFYE